MPLLPMVNETFRFRDGRVDLARQVAEETEVEVAATMRALLDWWLRIPGARLPHRPPAEVIEQVRARQQQRIAS